MVSFWAMFSNRKYHFSLTVLQNESAKKVPSPCASLEFYRLTKIFRWSSLECLEAVHSKAVQISIKKCQISTLLPFWFLLEFITTFSLFIDLLLFH